MNRSGGCRSANTDDLGAIGTTCEGGDCNFSIGRVEKELMFVTIRVRQLDPFANGEMEHRILGRKIYCVKQHLDGPDIIRADAKTLFALIDDTGSIDRYIAHIIKDFVALKILADTAGQTISRKPDWSRLVKSISICSIFNDQGGDSRR